MRCLQVATNLWIRREFRGLELVMGVRFNADGWARLLSWRLQFPVSAKVTPESLKAKWGVITKFDDKVTYPTSTAESLESVSRAFLSAQ